MKRTDRTTDPRLENTRLRRDVTEDDVRQALEHSTEVCSTREEDVFDRVLEMQGLNMEHVYGTTEYPAVTGHILDTVRQMQEAGSVVRKDVYEHTFYYLTR